MLMNPQRIFEDCIEFQRISNERWKFLEIQQHSRAVFGNNQVPENISKYLTIRNEELQKNRRKI